MSSIKPSDETKQRIQEKFESGTQTFKQGFNDLTSETVKTADSYLKIYERTMGKDLGSETSKDDQKRLLHSLHFLCQKMDQPKVNDLSGDGTGPIYKPYFHSSDFYQTKALLDLYFSVSKE